MAHNLPVNNRPVGWFSQAGDIIVGRWRKHSFKTEESIENMLSYFVFNHYMLDLDTGY